MLIQRRVAAQVPGKKTHRPTPPAVAALHYVSGNRCQRHRSTTKGPSPGPPSYLLSAGRSPSITRSDGETSGHWNIWVVSVLSARATGARPFWERTPCRAIAWGPTALTAHDFQRPRDPPACRPSEGKAATATILSQRQPHFLARSQITRLTSLGMAIPRVRIAASRPTMSRPDRTLTVPALFPCWLADPQSRSRMPSATAYCVLYHALLFGIFRQSASNLSWRNFPCSDKMSQHTKPPYPSPPVAPIAASDSLPREVSRCNRINHNGPCS